MWVIEQFVATQISLHGGETFANPLYSTQCLVMTNVIELNQSSVLAPVELNVYLTCGTYSAAWFLGLGTYLFLKAKPPSLV